MSLLRPTRGSAVRQLTAPCDEVGQRSMLLHDKLASHADHTGASGRRLANEAVGNGVRGGRRTGCDRSFGLHSGRLSIASPR